MAEQREILGTFPMIEVVGVATIFVQHVKRHGLFGITRIKFVDRDGKASLFIRAYSTDENLPMIEVLPEIKEEVEP